VLGKLQAENDLIVNYVLGKLQAENNFFLIDYIYFSIKLQCLKRLFFQKFIFNNFYKKKYKSYGK